MEVISDNRQITVHDFIQNFQFLFNVKDNLVLNEIATGYVSGYKYILLVLNKWEKSCCNRMSH